MYISKVNRKFIDDFRCNNKDFKSISDNYILTIIKKTDKAVAERIAEKAVNDIIAHDPLKIL